MESKIAGYKLVPETNGCEGCVYYKSKFICNRNQVEILDCHVGNGFIYVPADTAIEVPKVNQQKK